ncbi:hypothetical protein DRW03_21175 [Corallococcus sp. H22C18031201]|nr:hypothetical protein DRW03_21175 [Corallococcus sp. H22C18031201]
MTTPTTASLATLLEESAGALDAREVGAYVERCAAVLEQLREARVAAADAELALAREPDDSPDWHNRCDWVGEARRAVLRALHEVEELRTELERHARSARLRARVGAPSLAQEAT